MATTYDVGDTVQLGVTFTDISGKRADPTTVSVRVLDPLGAEVTLAVEHDESFAGEYSAVLPLTAPGVWTWRWQGVGEVGAASEGTITVRSSAFS